jgi:hypothetical protein
VSATVNSKSLLPERYYSQAMCRAGTVTVFRSKTKRFKNSRYVHTPFS